MASGSGRELWSTSGSVLAQCYSKHCVNLGLIPDPSVMVSLQTGWYHVTASNSFSLLPLLLTIREHQKSFNDKGPLTSLRLCPTPDSDLRFSDPLTDANARSIRGILELCDSLKELDLSGVGLGSKGVLEIGLGIKHSQSIQMARLRGNPRGFAGFANPKVIKAVTDSDLLCLDISENHLDYSILKLYHKNKKPSLLIVDHGNHLWEESLNTLTHAIGSLFSIVGSWVLLWNAYGQSRRKFYASLLYSFTVIFLFSSSAIYHSAYANKYLSDILHILDHCAIYLLIAGSYTPYCLIALEDIPMGVYVAIAEWCLAFFGIILTFTSKRIKIPYKSTIELVLYIGMGHLVYVVWEDAITHVPTEAVELLKYGGYAYTSGVIFFLLDKYHPIGHTIWHIFVLAGATFHYFGILLYVVGLHNEGSIGSCEAETNMASLPHPA